MIGAGTRHSDDPDAPIGNGRAISVLAAREGAAVACVDRDADAASETARSGGGRRAGQRRSSSATSPTRPSARVRSTSRSRRSAGSTGSCATSASAKAAVSRERRSRQWDAVFAVNVRAHFLAVPRRVAAHDRRRARSCSCRRSRVCDPAPGFRRTTRRRRRSPDCAGTSRSRVPGSGCAPNVVAPGLIDTPLGRRATARATEPGPDSGAARTPGHGVGGCGAGRVPAERRRELHHRPDARRRRGSSTSYVSSRGEPVPCARSRSGRRGRRAGRGGTVRDVAAGRLGRGDGAERSPFAYG